MPCDNCKSNRLIGIYAKSSDRNVMWIGHFNYEHDGYVLPDLGIGGDDDVSFTYCLDCGKIQGTFPISDDTVRDTLCKNGCKRDGN